MHGATIKINLINFIFARIGIKLNLFLKKPSQVKKSSKFHIATVEQTPYPLSIREEATRKDYQFIKQIH
jgi:hypothetical protein